MFKGVESLEFTVTDRSSLKWNIFIVYSCTYSTEYTVGKIQYLSAFIFPNLGKCDNNGLYIYFSYY